MAAEAASLAGLLDEASEHGDRWLAEARRQGDTSHEAKALSLRMRVAFELGDLAATAALTEELIGMLDQLPDEERAMAMASVAQSYMVRDLIEPTREWADKALALAEANDFETVRLTAMVEKGSVLVIEPATTAEGVALLQEAADEAERTGDHVLAARALVNLVWQARMTSRFAEARELVQRMRQHAETAGFDSLASYARVEALAALAAADGDLDSALDVLDRGTRADPAHALPRNRRWLAVLRAGLALEADDLEAAATFTEEAKPVTARSRGGVLGLDANLAARQGDLPRARERLAELLAVVSEEGYAPPSQVHDIMAASLRAGLDPAELRPFVEARRHLPGQPAARRPPHCASSSTRSWRRPRAARRRRPPCTPPRPRRMRPAACRPDHRGTAEVGAARCLIALGSTGRSPRPRRDRRRAPGSLARLAGRRARSRAAAARRRTRADRARRR